MIKIEQRYRNKTGQNIKLVFARASSITIPIDGLVQVVVCVDDRVWFKPLDDTCHIRRLTEKLFNEFFELIET